MINWTASQFNHSSPLRAAQLLERFFSSLEMEEYQKFRIPKRQSEWLASRLLVKQLVQKVLTSELPFSLRSISIHKEPSGVPFVEVEGLGRVGWLSLSHSRGGALAAFSPEKSIRFGVDLEFIEARPIELFSDYFTPSEIAWITDSNEHEKEFNSNLVWSAKEAYLKAIEKGLQMDTRKINIHPFSDEPRLKGWNGIDFEVKGMDVREWQLLFSHQQNYVMTMCLPENQKFQRVEIEDWPLFDD